MKPLPDDYTLRLVDLPCAVGGRISETPDGHIDIYINARYSQAGRIRAAEHEFDHWRHGDLDSDRDIRDVERRRRLPPLMKARDLIPRRPARPPAVLQYLSPISPPPKPAASCITRTQMRLALEAISDLDAAFFAEPVIAF